MATDEETPVPDEAPVEAPNLKAALKFMEGWMLMPPLIRASAASSITDMLEHMIERAGRDSAQDQTRGMARRSRVGALCGLSYVSVQDLMIDLVKLADAEAVEMGIDADIRYEPDGGTAPLMDLLTRNAEMKPSKWVALKEGLAEGIAYELEVAIGDKAAEDIASEADKEVLDDLTSGGDTVKDENDATDDDD